MAGAELCKADLDDLESLKVALKGADYCFAVTDWWVHHDNDREIQQVGRSHLKQQHQTSCRIDSFHCVKRECH